MPRVSAYTSYARIPLEPPSKTRAPSDTTPKPRMEKTRVESEADEDITSLQYHQEAESLHVGTCNGLLL
jgi:hypothetical protein